MHADLNWLGLLFLVGGLLFNVIKSLQRGKVESEETAAQPARPKPSPVPAPPLRGRSLDQLFDELSKGLETAPAPAPTVPRPTVSLPTATRRAPLPPQPSPLAIARKTPESPDDPAGLLTKGGQPLFDTAAETINPQNLAPMAVAVPLDSEASRFAWLRQRLTTPLEVQRSIVLTEILGPPVSLK